MGESRSHRPPSSRISRRDSLLTGFLWNSKTTSSSKKAVPDEVQDRPSKISPGASSSKMTSGYRRKTRNKWPPKPTVEDEADSIAREHITSVSPETSSCDGPSSQGTVDQTPIILDANYPQHLDITDESVASTEILTPESAKDTQEWRYVHIPSAEDTTPPLDENHERRFVHIPDTEEKENTKTVQDTNAEGGRHRRSIPRLHTDFNKEASDIKRDQSPYAFVHINRSPTTRRTKDAHKSDIWQSSNGVPSPKYQRKKSTTRESVSSAQVESIPATQRSVAPSLEKRHGWTYAYPPPNKKDEPDSDLSATIPSTTAEKRKSGRYSFVQPERARPPKSPNQDPVHGLDRAKRNDIHQNQINQKSRTDQPRSKSQDPFKFPSPPESPRPESAQTSRRVNFFPANGHRSQGGANCTSYTEPPRSPRPAPFHGGARPDGLFSTRPPAYHSLSADAATLSPSPSAHFRDSEASKGIPIPSFRHTTPFSTGHKISLAPSAGSSESLPGPENPDISSRFSNQPSEEIKTKPLPVCPRPKYTDLYSDWTTLLDEPSFNICPACFDSVVAPSQYRSYFGPSPKRSPGSQTICDFNLPWIRVAWLLTLKHRRPNLDILCGIARISAKVAPCPGSEVAVRQWHTVLDPDSKNPVPNFDICECCVKSLETILPSLRGYFVKVNYGPFVTLKRTCDMRFQSKRFIGYVEVLEETVDKALETRKPLNMREFAIYARKRASLRECKGDTPLFNKGWHFIPQIPLFTVCEECYHDVVRPSVEAGSTLACKFNSNLQLTRPSQEGVSCQLYSPRMRKIFSEAVAKNDFRYLAEKAIERRDSELSMRQKQNALKRAYDARVDPYINHANPFETFRGKEPQPSRRGEDSAISKDADAELIAQLARINDEWKVIS
ncbi:MAG: hypothetical protein M1829_005993 [Trizodia sp. TS-e1964]|nr:MAG: hypothetical protein M1829_005993 [Trizodia sp. TS-e1964]